MLFKLKHHQHSAKKCRLRGEKMNSYDARVRYTRKVIEESLLTLLQKKHISKITVTELCEMAQINRATFYKHYADVPKLLEEIEERLFEQIRQMFGKHALSLEVSLLDMLTYTKSEGLQFMVLGSEKTFMVCYDSVYPLLEQNISTGTVEELQLLYQFLSYGSGGILTQWIHNGMQEAPEKILKLILRLCNGAAKAFDDAKRD